MVPILGWQKAYAVELPGSLLGMTARLIGWVIATAEK